MERTHALGVGGGGRVEQDDRVFVDGVPRFDLLDGRLSVAHRVRLELGGHF